MDLSHWHLRNTFTLRQASTLMAGYDPNIGHIHDSAIQAKQHFFQEELIEAAGRTAFSYQQLAVAARDQQFRREINIEKGANYLPSTQLLEHARDWKALITKLRATKNSADNLAFVAKSLGDYPRVFQNMVERCANADADLVYDRSVLGNWCSAGGVQSAYKFTAETPKAIDWDKWRIMPRLLLWEAAALSCDQPPEAAKNHLRLNNLDSEIANPLRAAWASLFNDRIEMLRRNTTKGNALYLKGAHFYPNSNFLELDTVQFATFVRDHAWQVPSELVALASAPQIAAVAAINSKWPWGDYETDLLRLLPLVYESHWRGYDPKRPASAPKSLVVENWLVQEHKAPKRVAEVIAQIFRADALPNGPRRTTK